MLCIIQNFEGRVFIFCLEIYYLLDQLYQFSYTFIFSLYKILSHRFIFFSHFPIFLYFTINTLVLENLLCKERQPCFLFMCLILPRPLVT